MADDSPTPETPDTEAATAEDTPADLGDAGLKALQAEREKRKALERKVRELAPKAAKLAEIEDSQKSESQRAADEAAALRAEANQARLEAMRIRVGVAAGLPLDAVVRLQGTTEEELAADAEALAALISKPPVNPSTAPTPTLVSGAVTPADQPPTDANAWLRETAARRR